MKTRSPAVSALCGFVLALASCSSATSDWNRTVRENTIAGYHNCLAAHPQDQGASETEAIILGRQDDESWIEAKHTATTAAYQDYLKQYPKGIHAGDARNAMTSLGRAAAWKRAQGEGTTASIQAFLLEYPTGTEADQAKMKLEDLTDYRVRLASESSNDKAERRLLQLKARFRDQVHDLVVMPDVNDKSFSVDSDGMTEQEAKSACDGIKRKHQSCDVVQRVLLL
jgi:hypothetical protein